MIVGWKSPLDGKVYALNDFASLNRVVPEPVLRAMARKVELDERHRGYNITITTGLSCPRKMLVSRMLPFTPDPTKTWKMQRGTWLHECVGMSLAENPEWITEEGDAEACTFEGRLFGVHMSCRIDARRKDWSEVIDWKFRGDGAERWVDPMGRAKDEDAAQLNMARMLMEQQTGKDLSDMAMFVWVMAGQMCKTTAPVMSEEQVGAIRPGGGKYNIKEIFGMLNVAVGKWQDAAGDKPESVHEDVARDIIGSLPMVGEEMYKSTRTPGINMCTRYCEMQEACYECSGGL